MKRTQAKCSPEDYFDFEKDSRIAFNRLFTDIFTNGYINVSANNEMSEIQAYNVQKLEILKAASSLLNKLILMSQI